MPLWGQAWVFAPGWSKKREKLPRSKGWRWQSRENGLRGYIGKGASGAITFLILSL